MAAVTFYMTPGSCSTAIHILLEEIGEVFAAAIVDLPAGDHHRPDFLAINPKASIPVIVTRERLTITEVPAIAYWLARAHPRARLWPDTIAAETRALEIMTYVTGTIHGQGFARLFTTESFSSLPAARDELRVAGGAIIEKGFAVLERIMPETRYALDAFSAVDPVLFYVEFWADKLGMSLPPNLLRHYRLMLTRPTVIQVLREEGYNPASLGRLGSA